MKTKWVDKTADGQMIAIVELTEHEIILIKEAVQMYDDKRLGDADDSNVIKIKQELKKELHEAWKQLRPS
ncbi:MAG: hypothetical protein WBN72_07415 [Nitrososphaeraceae archaeon]